MGSVSGLSEFERDLLESVRQAQAGEFAAVHTPAQIAVRKRSRMADSIVATHKLPTSMRLAPNVMGTFRASGNESAE